LHSQCRHQRPDSAGHILRLCMQCRLFPKCHFMSRLSFQQLLHWWHKLDRLHLQLLCPNAVHQLPGMHVQRWLQWRLPELHPLRCWVVYFHHRDHCRRMHALFCRHLRHSTSCTKQQHMHQLQHRALLQRIGCSIFRTVCCMPCWHLLWPCSCNLCRHM